MIEQSFGLMSQIILAIALPYFALSIVLGIRVVRRDGLRLSTQESRATGDARLPLPMALYVLIPCLNEEVVIASTVTSLVSGTNCTVVVIDDGSDDGTAARAEQAARDAGASGRFLAVRRTGAQSRLGKGAALNAGLPVVEADVVARGLSARDVVVAVMDADGRLSAGAAHAALAMFADRRVGAVQLVVRIRDRRKLIAQFQDVEFWMISALSQFARSISGTVSLGGNGQFARLVALQHLDGPAWSTSLTEDLDLGLRLITDGWRITTTRDAYVDQQAVDTFPRLLRQRTRWYQGHMESVRRLPSLWRSDKVNEVAVLEVSSYLLVPWLIVLPWSILQQWIVFQLVAGSGHGILASGLGGVSWRITYGLLWYVLSFAPNILIGVIYARRTQSVTLGRALVLGHLMIAWNYIGYLAAWRAVGRMVRRRSDWTKTTRSAELDVAHAAPVAPATFVAPIASAR